MRASSIAQPIRSFQSRLNRVAEARAPLDASSTEVSALPDWKRHLIEPFRALCAILVGGLAVFVARAARHHIFGGTFGGADPNMALLIDAGLALVLAVLICFALNFRSAMSMVGQFVGVAAMVLGMHNAAHFAPGAFSTVYSPAWTQEIVAASEPGSVLLRDTFVNLASGTDEDTAEDAEEGVSEEPVKPRIIRLQ